MDRITAVIAPRRRIHAHRQASTAVAVHCALTETPRCVIGLTFKEAPTPAGLDVGGELARSSGGAQTGRSAASAV
jgi:hypothetical protein